MTHNVLRFLAIAGIGWRILAGLVFADTSPERVEYAYYVLFATAAAVLVMLFTVRRSSALLARNPDILVPFGIYLLLSTFLPSAANAALVNASGDGVYFPFLRTLTPMSFVGAVANILMIGWTVRLILQVTESGRADLLASFHDFRWWFLRTALVKLFLGFVLILWLIIMFSPVFGGAPDGDVLFRLSGILMTLTAVAFNVTTFAVLLVVLRDRTPLLSSFAAAIEVGPKFAARCALPLVAQFLLVGSIVYVSVHYETTGLEKKNTVTETTVSPSETVTTTKSGNETTVVTKRIGASRKVTKTNLEKWTTSIRSKDSFTAKVLWLFEFPTESNWLTTTMDAVESKAPDVIVARLSILLMIFAVVAKIDFASRIFGVTGERFSELGNGYRPEVMNVVAVAVLIAILIPVELFVPANRHTASHAEEAVRPN